MNIIELIQSGVCALAPMAGVADRAFRELCTEYGAAFCTTEMVSAKGIVMGDRKSDELMTIGASERPCGIQLFGSEPSMMEKASAAAIRHEPDFIDINMGCPAPKVIKTGSGSALLKEPMLAEKLIAAVKKTVNVPVSAKMRIGWDDATKNHIEFAKAAEAGGADFITVHGRTRTQMYMPPADLQAIAEVKQAVDIPVVGNGDVSTPEQAKQMLERTGCDSVMIGRAALGAPWIFRQTKLYLSTGQLSEQPSNTQKMSVMLRHADLICKYKGNNIGICEIRKHALWYTKGLRGAAQLRNRFSTLKSMEELKELAHIIAEQN